MDLRSASRRLNKRLGGGHEMACSRAWRSRRWWIILPLDALFLMIDGEPGHCRACYLIDHPQGDGVVERARRAGM